MWRLLVAGLLGAARSSSAQVYPEWFLDPHGTECPGAIVGYATPALRADASVALAIADAGERLARHRQVTLKGSQAFWATPLGMAWMGSDVIEVDDTTGVGQAMAALAPLDTAVSGNLVTVLLGSAACGAPATKARRVDVRSTRPPSWVTAVPGEPGYVYAVGLAPSYYYEASSWAQAERHGRVNLARSWRVRLRELQKVGGSQVEAVTDEELDATLTGAAVAARWVDAKTGIYYALVRMRL